MGGKQGENGSEDGRTLHAMMKAVVIAGMIHGVVRMGTVNMTMANAGGSNLKGGE